MVDDTRADPEEKRSLVVLYDGFCPVCRRSARIIRRLDYLHAIRLMRYQDFSLDNLPVPLEKLSKRIQACDTNLSNCREGIFAFTSILVRIPPLFPVSFFSFILSRTGLGQKIYDFISENRYNLPLSGITSLFMPGAEKRGEGK